MAFTYANRKGQVYYLHTGTTKAGKPRWFMSTKSDGTLADAIPEGYEVWESPEDAQVFVRKVPRRIISEEEVKLVLEVAQARAQTRYVIVDVKGKDIIVYAADDDLDARVRLMAAFGNPDPAGTLRFMEQHLRYEPMLRFELTNPKTRGFYAYRWCFLGSIDDWHHLKSGTLAELAGRYIPHLGAESFFDLM